MNDEKTAKFKNDLPKIALGAWAWGNDGTFGQTLDKEQLKPVFDRAMELGLNLWDTAYAYGMGASEKMLAELMGGYPRDSYIISDKFTPQCADKTSESAVKDMTEMQKDLLQTDSIDIYWLHNVADSPYWIEEIAKFFKGRENAPMIGVSNHNLAEIRQAEDILKAHGLELSAVQNHFSPLNRSSEESGILQYCKEKGIPFFAYMVLEQGALSGKYDRKHPMPEESARGKAYNQHLDKLEVLNRKLSEVAEKMGYSMSYLSHFIKECFGISFQEYLMILRCEKARQLLHTTKLPQLDICESCGFSDPKYFKKSFYSLYGCFPKEYRSRCALTNESFSGKISGINMIYD